MVVCPEGLRGVTEANVFPPAKMGSRVCPALWVGVVTSCFSPMLGKRRKMLHIVKLFSY